jgi:hypothetical protein
MLGLAGMGLNEIRTYFNTDPDAISENLIVPGTKDFDINMTYLNPFNSKGIFAPLEKMAGITGVNPMDYLLDFTQFSPQFGYSNLMTGSIDKFVTGKGDFTGKLDEGARLASLAEGAVSSSFTKDLPKITDPTNDMTDRTRHLLRFFGVDVTERNVKYKGALASRAVVNKIRRGESLDGITQVLDFMGFDSKKIVKNAVAKVRKERKTAPTAKGGLEKAADYFEQLISESQEQRQSTGEILAQGKAF